MKHHFWGVILGLAFGFGVASLLTGEIQWLGFLFATGGFSVAEGVRRYRRKRAQLPEMDERVKYETLVRTRNILFISQALLFFSLVLYKIWSNHSFIKLDYVVLYLCLSFAALFFFNKK
ncbi:hypothetical protein [Paludifilum halophilum]|uniref:DUF2178 domain-containing protein n=1 Tax=Paludifilum halophilum TaxID=1642702 RepID=A0A235B7C6_9BACL|nr:hypothetical protein [Paludifilum halophilum]OYD08132.1 hypothetical protein CHM34_08460 [Paludifilum halophilum]